MARGKLLTTISILSALGLTGCFTGVDSTPRIAAPSQKLVQRTTLPEDSFLSRVTPEAPGLWQRGKQFFITDERFKLLLGATAPADSLQGTMVSFDGWNDAVDITGRGVTDLRLTTAQGASVACRIGLTSAELAERRSWRMPFAIEMSVVESARQLLQNRRLWTMTRNWRDTLDTPVTGRRFVEVTVTNVAPGNEVHPLRIDFVEVADSTRRGSLFLNPDEAAGNASRTFASQFSLTNPRPRYPAVTDEFWPNIIDGTVAPGMTTVQCRLSLGDPASIVRRNSTSILREEWSYDNGQYLIFEDDRLISYRP